MRSPEIDRAEERVRAGTEHLEVAMDHLEERLHDTSEKVRSVIDSVKHPNRTLDYLVLDYSTKLEKVGEVMFERMQSFAQFAISEARRLSQEASRNYKENPTPFIATAIGGCCCALLVGLYLGRSRSPKGIVTGEVLPQQHEFDLRVERRFAA